MPPKNQSGMAVGRGILTDGEQKYLAGEETKQREYEARSRVRSRIEGPLSEEVTFLADHHPDLLEELREVVCEE
jgi:hypothetical protein